MASIPVSHKKRGRPATGQTPRIGVRLSPEIISALDKFLEVNQEAKFADRSDLLRTIIRDWLIGAGYLENPPDREDAN